MDSAKKDAEKSNWPNEDAACANQENVSSQGKICGIQNREEKQGKRKEKTTEKEGKFEQEETQPKNYGCEWNVNKNLDDVTRKQSNVEREDSKETNVDREKSCCVKETGNLSQEEEIPLGTSKPSDNASNPDFNQLASCSSVILNTSGAIFPCDFPNSYLIADGGEKTSRNFLNSPNNPSTKPVNKHSVTLPEKCTPAVTTGPLLTGSYNNLLVGTSTGGTAYLGLSSPGAQVPRKTSDVVKERVANLGVIPETPHSSTAIPPVTLNWKWIKTSRDILSEEEILRHLEPLRRSQSDFGMSERARANTMTSCKTSVADGFEPDAVPGTPRSPSIDQEDSPFVNFKCAPLEPNRPKTSTCSYKRKRDWTKKRNPFVGVIGRSASVRTDNSKSGYQFNSVVSQDILDEPTVAKCDSTPSLNNLSYDLNRNMAAKISDPCGTRRAGSFSSALTSRNSYSGKRSNCVIDEPLVSTPLMTRQLTAASLTAETAELLGTPTPVEFDVPDRTGSRGSGGGETNTAIGVVYYLVLNAIRDSIQPTNNKMALKLFGSKKCVLKEKKRCEEEAPWIIHPFSTFRFCWDFTMLCLLITNMIVLPVAIAFFNEESSITWAIFNCLNDGLFITDIVLNFRTGIAHQHMAVQVILDPQKIKVNYLKGWFIIDLLSSMPMDYIFLIMSHGESGSPSILNASRTLKMLRLTKFLSLMRLLRVSRLMRYANQWQEIFNLASAAIRILNLIFMMIIISHWNGCLMFLLPRLYEFPRDSWVYVDRLVGKEWTEQYSWALFRAMSHMLCIGYGQEPPTSIMDLWLVMISMISGATCYALFIGNATNMIHQFDSSRRQYTEKIKQVEEYMAHRKLPPDLQVRVHEYYEYKFKGKMFDEDVILDEMNDCLREEILNYNCRELVNVVPFFQGADPLFVSGVVAKLKHEVYQPGDYVIMEGTIGTKMFFIQQGTVDVVTNNGNCVAQLFDGSYFGEICLLAKIKRTASIRAESYCNLYSLEVEDFNEVLTEFPQMRSQLEIVARERLAQLGKRTNVLETKSRLKHQDMSYGVAISTDDFAEIAEMANEETRKMVRRLSVMLENSEPWRSTNSRGGSPSQCDCRRASEGMLTFEEVTEQEDEGQTGSTNHINITQNPIQVEENNFNRLASSGSATPNIGNSVHMRIGSVSLGSLNGNLDDETSESEQPSLPTQNTHTTGSDSEVFMKK